MSESRERAGSMTRLLRLMSLVLVLAAIPLSHGEANTIFSAGSPEFQYLDLFEGVNAKSLQSSNSNFLGNATLPNGEHRDRAQRSDRIQWPGNDQWPGRLRGPEYRTGKRVQHDDRE